MSKSSHSKSVSTNGWNLTTAFSGHKGLSLTGLTTDQHSHLAQSGSRTRPKHGGLIRRGCPEPPIEQFHSERFHRTVDCDVTFRSSTPFPAMAPYARRSGYLNENRLGISLPSVLPSQPAIRRIEGFLAHDRRGIKFSRRNQAKCLAPSLICSTIWS